MFPKSLKNFCSCLTSLQERLFAFKHHREQRKTLINLIKDEMKSTHYYTEMVSDMHYTLMYVHAAHDIYMYQPLINDNDNTGYNYAI